MQESGLTSGDDPSRDAPSSRPLSAAVGDSPPPPAKPPRPLTEAQKNIGLLKEAFPGIEEPVIKAVLTASGGRIDPAFNALLGTN